MKSFETNQKYSWSVCSAKMLVRADSAKKNKTFLLAANITGKQVFTKCAEYYKKLLHK